MGESEDKSEAYGQPLNQPLTWMCPEGHVFKYRRRPLLSSCVFIFCFFIMERSALYILKTFLYVHLERTLNVDPYSPSFGFLMISVFFGVYDFSPILIAVLSDTYLGGYKSIAIFGFVFVFGLTLMALFGGSWFQSPLGPSWCAIVSLLGLVAVSAGGLVPCLTAFGGSQFQPQTQTVSGSRFFSLIFASTNIGAITGIITAIIIYSSVAYRYVLLSSAAMGLVGWVAFLAGSGLYVNRCVHTPVAVETVSLVWDCVRKRSFDRNRISHGGNYRDSLVDDVVILARLLPVFACLIPLYSGQLQVFTTFRSLGYKLHRPANFFSRSMPAELMMLTEPLTAILLSLVLDSFVWPMLQARKRMPTHLTRLTIGATCIAAGFVSAFALHRHMMASGSELHVFGSVSIFLELPALILFSAGQVLITSSGLELSYSHAPETLRSVSVSMFSLIYALGSILAVILFASLRGVIDEPSRRLAKGKSESHGIQSRFDIYFGICAILSVGSIVGLLALRRFYAKSRQIFIDRDVDRRAMEIALRRVRALSEQKPLVPEQAGCVLGQSI